MGQNKWGGNGGNGNYTLRSSLILVSRHLDYLLFVVFKEKNVTCRGGLILWDEYLIVGCYNIEDESDEVGISLGFSYLAFYQ